MEVFDRIKVIGKGSYGEVWLAKHKKDKKQYVLKRINLQRASKRERTSAEQEARLLQKLRHPNIVAYKQSFETVDGMLYIAMQYCEGGDLYTRLKELKGQLLEERQVVEWFVQIAMALQYMHERNILHRDLKTQNIFLTKSKIIKVGDLGIARVLDGATDMATTLIGTPYYMSPELFSNKPYNHKSDVWALGCCVYEMTTLKHAFNAKDMNALVYKILKGKLPPMPRQYGGELLALMRCMLHQDPDKRPSVNRLLRDPYIKRNIARFLEETQRNSGARSRQSGVAAAKRKPTSASPGQSSPASTQQASVASQPSASSSNDSGSGAKPPAPRPNSSSSNSSQPATEDASRVSGVPPRPSNSGGGGGGGGGSSSSSSAADSSRVSGIVPPRGASSVPREASLGDESKDEPDSSCVVAPGKGWQNVNSAGDAPPAAVVAAPVAFKPGHVRRPSNLAPKELEPIEEDGVVARNSAGAVSGAAAGVVGGGAESDDSEKEDTVKTNTVKEAKEATAAEEGRKKKKKKKKLVPSRPAVNSPAGPEKEAADAQSARSDVSSSDRPLSARPLPMPKVEVSEGLPQKREALRQVKKEGEKGSDSTSSKSSSDGVIDDTPRSLKSARERRREASKSTENPPSARNIKLRQVPSRTASQKVTKKERTEAPEVSVFSSSRQRQPSVQDSSSSDESTVATGENTQEREKRRQNEEMDNFISLLDNTLQMNSELDQSDEELKEVPLKSSSSPKPPRPSNGRQCQGVPALQRKHSLDVMRVPALVAEQRRPSPPPPEEPALALHKSASMPSVDTLTCTSRLMDRIRLLHRDCVKGVGYSVLKQAYDILNRIEEDEVEPKLMELLGKENFDEFAGKIWQLKFCEESLFMAS